MQQSAKRQTQACILAEAQRGVSPGPLEREAAADPSLHVAPLSGLGDPIAASAYQVNPNWILLTQSTRPFLAVRIVPTMEEHLAFIDARKQFDAAATAIRHQCHTTPRWWNVTS